MMMMYTRKSIINKKIRRMSLYLERKANGKLQAKSSERALSLKYIDLNLLNIIEFLGVWRFKNMLLWLVCGVFDCNVM